MLSPEKDPFLKYDSLEMEALTWLQDPGLLYRLQEAISQIDAPKGYLVEENDNAIQLLFDVIQKQSVEVRGETGSGKNTLADAVFRIVPEGWAKKVAGLTDKSIRYLPENIRILYVVERKGLVSGEDSRAEYDMKVSISEGKLTYLYVERDEENKLVTKEKEVDVGQFVTTSTDVAFNELENRLDVIQVHDDREQNARVRDVQLTKAALFPWQTRNYEAEQRVARKVTEHIDRETRDLDVVIPFARALIPLLRSEQQAVRRHGPKLLNMVEACARAHYRQRPIVEGPDGRKCIVALPLDLLIVLNVARSNIEQMLGEISPKMILVVDLCKELVGRAEQITAPNIHALAKEKKRAELSSPRTVQQLFRSLADSAVIRQRFDQEGKAVKAYHGALVYDLLQESGSALRIDVGGIMAEASVELDTWYNNAGDIGLPPLPQLYSFTPIGSGQEVGVIERIAPSVDAPRLAAPDAGSVSVSAEAPAVEAH